MLNEPPSKEKIFQLISSPHDIQQQTEYLLHKYELDDKTLQKAQLEQHKIFQNFLTSPAQLLQMLLLCQQAQLQKSLLCWNLS